MFEEAAQLVLPAKTARQLKDRVRALRGEKIKNREAVTSALLENKPCNIPVDVDALRKPVALKAPVKYSEEELPRWAKVFFKLVSFVYNFSSALSHNTYTIMYCCFTEISESTCF